MILFIPVVVLPGLNELGNINRFFVQKALSGSRALLFFQGMGGSLHKFQTVPNDRMISLLSYPNRIFLRDTAAFFQSHLFLAVTYKKKTTLAQGIM